MKTKIWNFIFYIGNPNSIFLRYLLIFVLIGLFIMWSFMYNWWHVLGMFSCGFAGRGLLDEILKKQKEKYDNH